MKVMDFILIACVVFMLVGMFTGTIWLAAGTVAVAVIAHLAQSLIVSGKESNNDRH